MQERNIISITANRKSGDGYRLPFGKYKCQRLSTVPTPYMRWLVSQAWLSEYSRFELMDELGRRGELFDEMVLEIISLKAEIERLRLQLDEAERRHHAAGLDVGTADEEFVRAVKYRGDVDDVRTQSVLPSPVFPALHLHQTLPGIHTKNLSP